MAKWPMGGLALVVLGCFSSRAPLPVTYCDDGDTMGGSSTA